AFFEFRQKFRPGDYEVGVLNAYGFFIESISYNGAPVANKMVRIRGTEPANLTITLQRGKSRIEGLVLSGSKPARGVMVVLIPEASLNAPASVRRAQSNTDGSFAFAMVTPGKYALLAIANGWELSWPRLESLKPFFAKSKQLQVAESGPNGTTVTLNLEVQ